MIILMFQNILRLHQCFFYVDRSEELVPVYNYVCGPENPITWGKLVNIMSEYRDKFGVNKSMYYPDVLLTKSYPVFLLIDYFVHYIPAVLIDIILKLLGRKPM